tara:strand:+ start:24 stop:2276 length:2253 start_codon:yes stop_codon:yes gene_type:complete
MEQYNNFLKNEPDINSNLIILESFISSNRNSDSRVYKYFLENSEYLTIIRNKVEFDTNYLITILTNLGNGIINTKYFLRRLKTLDKYLNLKPYIKLFHQIFHINHLIHLLPYYVNTQYFNEVNSNNLLNIFEYFNPNNNWDIEDQEKITYNKFITQVKKFNTEESLQNFKILIKGEYDNNKIINPTFIGKYIYITNFENKLLKNKKFIKEFIKNFKLDPVNIQIPELSLILVSEAISTEFDKEILILKRFFCKILNVKYKIKYYLNRFTNKIKNDSFTTIPPHHLFSNDILGDILLRPKADGTLVNSLNNNVEPCGIISNYIIKAEYIPELELYLVFDINIPLTNSLQRYEFLRKLHPYTKNYNTRPYSISSLNDIININEKEDMILQNFLDNTKGKRWFPKVTFEGNLSKKEYQVLLDHSSKSKKYHNSIYETDGFIIYYNHKESKLKPYDMMTIDIIYDITDMKWKDREGTDISNYIITKTIPKYSSIWRCYPILQNESIKFINKEIRKDKRRPNPNKIISLIIDYLESLRDKKYYQKVVKPSYNCMKIIKRQSIRFTTIINKYNIINKAWLDLGCGKGKLLKNIKNNMIYFGLDNDYNIITTNKRKFSNNKRAIFKQTNLLKDDISKVIPPLKFDYIVMNHSINHFYSNKLIELLNNYTKPGSIIIFNITNSNLKNRRITLGKGYIENKGGETTYLFPWVHNKTVKEKFIEPDRVVRDLSNFKVLEKNSYNDTKFESIYNWYVMKKI